MLNLLPKLQQALDTLELTINDIQLQKLIDYISLLQKWNNIYNLTSITNADEILVKHIIDCLAVIKYIPYSMQNSINILDVGSGAGLPSIIWAIMCPNWHIYSVDAVQKKIAFQQQAKISLKITNFTPLHVRIEDLQPNLYYKTDSTMIMDIITARAYANSNAIINQTKHLLAKNGSFVLLKGKDNEEIICQNIVVNKKKISVPFLHGDRHVILVKIKA